MERVERPGGVWYRLRVGGFATEAEARAALPALRARYPGAWIDRAGARVASGTTPAAPPASPPPRPEPSGTGPAVPPHDDGAEQVGLYAVSVNQQDFGVTTVVRRDDGRFLFRGADLDAWGLLLPPEPAAVVRGVAFYDPSGQPGFTLAVDEPRLALALSFDPAAFRLRRVGEPAALPTPVPSRLGAFANYDLLATYAEGSAAGELDGLFELGLFSRWGVVTSGFLGQDLIIFGGRAAPRDARLVRLETRYRRDWPARALTLELGDTIGRAGIWGRPVRFGGVQWGRDFGLQPAFVTFPRPALAGEAALPSTAELYIDGTLRQTQSVAPGPFELVELPVVTGGGEAKLVVRDLLGREQVIALPFYASNVLLREGLSDFGLEAGLVRERFGTASNDYGRAFAAGTARLGLSARLTVEGRAEVLQSEQTVGIGASYVFPFPVLATSAVALSRSEAGVGGLLFLGVERRISAGFTLAGQAEVTTRAFTRLGLPPGRPPPRLTASATLGFPPIGPGSTSVTYTVRDGRDGSRQELVSAFYALAFTGGASLSAFAVKSLAEPRDLTVGLTFVQALGERTTGVAGYRRRSGDDVLSAQVQRSLPVGEGVGYRLGVDTLTRLDRQEAEGAWRTRVGTYRAGLSRFDGDVTYRASADGGLAYQAGEVQATRPVLESFATVRVGGYPGVGVYLNNQPVARTDADGVAWIPGLLPYQENVVTIDVQDLPIDAEIDTASIGLVPYFRSGLVAEFPVRRAAGALLAIVLDDGGPLPAGAVVRIVGQPRAFPVALRGEVYVTGLETENRLEAEWRGQRCRLEVVVPAGAGPLPRLGPLPCAGVTR